MNMVPIVQLVRASDCGSECRGFESHWAPRKEVARLPFFVPAGVQIVTNYRTFIDDLYKVLEFVEWYKE